MAVVIPAPGGLRSPVQSPRPLLCCSRHLRGSARHASGTILRSCRGVRLRRACRVAAPAGRSPGRGPGRAAAELFEDATWFLTPTAATSPDRLRLVHGFVTALRARPVAIGPDAHDRLLALTSHLPHALANLLLNQAGATRVSGHEALAAAGGSLKDMTRVAGANPRIWVDIFLDNADAVRESLIERGLEAERIAILGYGEARPIAGNETAAGRQQNRRVEIVVSDERGSFGDEDRRANLQ